MFVKVTNGVPETYTIGQLRRDNPNTSFPSKLDDATLAAYNVYSVKRTPAPTYDRLTEVISEGTPALVDGQWTQQWEKKQLAVGTASDNVRARRDELLASSDWTQVQDVPVDKATWAAYRSELRDLPSQPGFPYNVAWPTEPSA